MPGQTLKGAPYPLGADPASTIDTTVQGLANWVDARPGIQALTTTQRDLLAGADLYPRIIWNITNAQLEAYDGAVWRRVYLGGLTKVRVGWTYTLPGDIKVWSSGPTNYLPPSFIAVGAGQGVTLVGYKWYSPFATSYTFRITHQVPFGASTDLVTGVVAASSSVFGSGLFGVPKACADGDLWYPTITAVTGTPSGGAVTMVADITL
jgi:hypothetical protein